MSATDKWAVKTMRVKGVPQVKMRRILRIVPAGLLAAVCVVMGAEKVSAQVPMQNQSPHGRRDIMGCGMQMGRMQGGMRGGMGMMGCGMGMNRMPGMGGSIMGGMQNGMGRMQGMQGGMADMGTIHGLFAETGTITRAVKNLPNGIEAVTESSEPNVAKMLQEHVAAMKTRLERGQPIRQGDPLFAALFQNADRIKIEVIPTERGVKVIETSDDPYTVRLLQSHAQAVSGFVRNGMAGMHTYHPAPAK